MIRWALADSTSIFFSLISVGLVVVELLVLGPAPPTNDRIEMVTIVSEVDEVIHVLSHNVLTG